MTLTDFLSSTEPKLAKAIFAFANAVSEIATRIRVVDTGKVGTENQFGEEQLALDILADQIIFNFLKKSDVIISAVSEEQDWEQKLNGTDFSVAFDPLDGSSLVDVNLAVGTIFGIWRGATIIGQTGRNLIAAGYAVYGPRTAFVFALNDQGRRPCEFTLNNDKEWMCTKNNLQINKGKMFAPGNLRATLDNANYEQLVNYWIKNGYTLRYSGGMVPDVHQILLKGMGVFSYPGSLTKSAKLRLAFECAPLAFIVESAGGASSDGVRSILDKSINAIDERTAVCLGAREEVRRFETYLKR